MLFRPLRVIYTVKSWILMLSMAKVSKNDLEVWLSISVAKIFFPGSYKFRKVFFNHGSCWRKRLWNSLYGHFSQKNAPVHASTRARARPSTHFIRLHCTLEVLTEDPRPEDPGPDPGPVRVRVYILNGQPGRGRVPIYYFGSRVFLTYPSRSENTAPASDQCQSACVCFVTCSL